jgi:formylglycine-generating enzyme required for sulfatase activity
LGYFCKSEVYVKAGNRLVFSGIFILICFVFTACPPETGDVFVAVKGVSMNKTTLTLIVGETETLIAMVNPENANFKFVSWYSDVSEVASVDSGGKVTALVPGSTRVTATSYDGGFLAECIVTVKPVVPVTSVTLRPEEVTLTIGLGEVGTFSLEAVILPEDASIKTISWSSSVPDVAIVEADGNRGTVSIRGLSSGKVTITVTVTTLDGSEKTADCIITVKVLPNINMVSIVPGTFSMGSPLAEPERNNDELQHQVTLSGFYMSKYPITQLEYWAVMGRTIEEQQESAALNDSSDKGRGDKYPIYYVSWYEALVFCNKLSMILGVDPVYKIKGTTDPSEWGNPWEWYGTDAAWDAVTIVDGANGYRLPTEAQWEYACRAGTTSAYSNGDTINSSTGWYNSNTAQRTNVVGRRPANAWGLYDMHGNIWEWCWDWYGSYSSAAQTDPGGPSSGTDPKRVVRGGAWSTYGKELRSAARLSYSPSVRRDDIGFRVVRTSIEP